MGIELYRSVSGKVTKCAEMPLKSNGKSQIISPTVQVSNKGGAKCK